MQDVHVGWTQMIQKLVRKGFLADNNRVVYSFCCQLSVCLPTNCTASKEVAVNPRL